jgi:hypothetical protein
MLAGRLPFDGDSTLGIILKHISEPPPPIDDVSPEIQRIINKALEKLPENRYQSGRELLMDFYNAVGMHAEAETLYSLRFRTPPPTVSVSNKPASSSSRFLWIGIGLLACICLSVVSAGVIGFSIYSSFPDAPDSQASTEESSPQNDTSHSAGTTEPGSTPQPISFGEFFGVLRFQGNMDQVTVTASLPDPAEGTQYEAWLIDDNGELLISLGIMEKNSSGQFTLAFTDPQSRNLLDGYNRMEITLETNPDASPNPSDSILYSSGIPASALTHVRHLLVSFPSNPNQTAMTIGLMENSNLVQDAGEELEKAYANNDQTAIRLQAETLINLIVGNQSSDYRDWDGNGKVNDPGDGFGLLLNGGQAGYIEGTITHSELSAAAADATANIKLHGEHVVVSAKNVEGWAAQLRDVAKRMLESDQITEADIRLAVSLAERVYQGVDIDGNESVDPVEGEGGALTAYQHAEYMADMQILEGVNLFPPPGNP